MPLPRPLMTVTVAALLFTAACSSVAGQARPETDALSSAAPVTTSTPTTTSTTRTTTTTTTTTTKKTSSTKSSTPTTRTTSTTSTTSTTTTSSAPVPVLVWVAPATLPAGWEVLEEVQGPTFRHQPTGCIVGYPDLGRTTEGAPLDDFFIKGLTSDLIQVGPDTLTVTTAAGPQVFEGALFAASDREMLVFAGDVGSSRLAVMLYCSGSTQGEPSAALRSLTDVMTQGPA